MNPLRNWNRCFLLWAIWCYCLLLLIFANPLLLKQREPLNNHSCNLSKKHFQRILIKDFMYTLASETNLYDKDTDNRFVGPHLFTNITRNEHCYLMKQVMDTVVTSVLHELTNRYPKVQEVAYFLVHLNAELSGCKPLGDKTHIERNLKTMKDKLDQLGENGKKKMVGELDILYEYLENACTEEPKETNSGHKSTKKN